MDEALMKRVLPHSVEAEQSVIGSMLMDKDAIIAASEIITAADFYQQQYGVSLSVWWSCLMRVPRVDLITLQNRLKEKDVPPEVQQSGVCAGHYYHGSDLSQCSFLCEYCVREISAAKAHQGQ